MVWVWWILLMAVMVGGALFPVWWLKVWTR